MRLAKLKVVDFKRVKSVELDLADLNILVGTNSSGKSSIIQAIHLGCCLMRQAARVESKTSTVGIDELDYLPTDNYKLLGHKTSWGNKIGTPSSQVELTFNSEGGDLVASCRLRSARNAGISIYGTVPYALTEMLRNRRKFFSAYIPGISGIPNREEKKAKKVVLKACSYGDSNIILRNVLLLLKEQSQGNLDLIQSWIREIIGPIRIVVDHDDESDLIVACSVEIRGDSRPIELIGTGYLQLIQIFSYVLLFEPGILLIDEPDIHLHPTVQEKLVQVLARVASERDLRILLTTHSPFIVRGSPLNTKVYWVKDGKIESQNRRQVELALGWGAFGKKLIVVSEDTDTSLLKKIIAQWPALEKSVAFYPCMGYRSLPTPQQAADIAEALGGKYKVVVHRDRDSLTDEEVDSLKQSYAKKGAYLWVPEFSDIEGYFCQSRFLAGFLGCSAADANNYVDSVLAKNAVPNRDQFNKQRASHNEELHKAGGGPANDEIWNIFQARSLKGAKGKFVFGQLKNVIPANAFREERILNEDLAVEIAPTLKTELEQLLKN